MKERFHQLNHLLSSAYAYRNYESVKRFAQEQLILAEQFPKDWNYGNTIHVANVFLGLVAMREGKTALAKEHLRKAGQTKGSPPLNTYGPNMLLAKELLEVGETEIVLNYLQQCKAFWLAPMRFINGQPLKKWKKAIEAGEMPDFGANLVYQVVAQPTKVTYRLLQPSEAKDYRRLRLESLQFFPNSFGANYEEQKAKKQLAFETYIKEQTPDKFIMGAFSNTTILGICGFYRNTDQREQHKGAIIQMYVSASYRGQQIGTSLLVTTLEKAFQIKEVEHINLGVYANNEAAVHLYKKAGFTTYGVEKNCMKIGEKYMDLIEMVIRRDEFKQREVGFQT